MILEGYGEAFRNRRNARDSCILVFYKSAMEACETLPQVIARVRSLYFYI